MNSDPSLKSNVTHNYPIDPFEVPIGLYEVRLRFLGKGNVHVGAVYRDDQNNPMLCLANEKAPRGSMADWMAVESLMLIRLGDVRNESEDFIVV